MTDLFSDLQRLLPRRYTLRRELGRGGMAVVYLAEEDRPRREVAIKVLNPGLTAHLGRERFLREVDLLSALNHPHIVPIFAAGEAGDLLYYVMPFQVGQTLREAIDTAGRLDVGFSLTIAREVAGALDYAHARDVVHRDIKPENILISGSHALVADFGIARAIRQAGDSSITHAGIAVGTPTYMSPEQAASDDELDGRADVYALGCVLFEMLTGTPPYSGRSRLPMIARHALDPVPSIREARPELSLGVEAAVTRALQKAPTDRHDGAAQFAAALESAATEDLITARTPSGSERQSISPQRPRPVLTVAAAVMGVALAVWGLTRPGSVAPAAHATVAVLPLQSFGGVATDHVATGLAHEITGRLARDSNLTVMAHSSVLAIVEGGDRSVSAVSSGLGVDYVLDGTVSPVGDSILITAELIRAATGGVVWSNRYEVARADALGLQDQIARGVTMALVMTSAGTVAVLARDIAHSPGHEAYLRGDREASRRTRRALAEAEAAYHEAIRLDPLLAPAHAGLASVYGLSLYYRYDMGAPAYEIAGRGLAHADRAIDLDPELTVAYSARGLITAAAFAPTELVRADFEEALRLAPSSPNASAWSGALLIREERFEQALANSLRAVDLDPKVPSRRLTVALQALRLRRYDLVVEHTRVADAFAPTLLRPRELQALGLLMEGRWAECLALDLEVHQGLRAACSLAMGDSGAAEVLVDSALAVAEGRREPDGGFGVDLYARDLAVYFAQKGDLANSAKWCEVAFEVSPLGIDIRVLESGLFDRVIDEPVFRDSLERVRGGVWNRVNGERRRAAEILGF